MPVGNNHPQGHGTSVQTTPVKIGFKDVHFVELAHHVIRETHGVKRFKKNS